MRPVHTFLRSALTPLSKIGAIVCKARLGLVNLKEHKFWKEQFDRRCRKCGLDETLSHVLNHCMVRSQIYLNIHNGVVKRIKKTASGRWLIVDENQVVGSKNQRPDLVLIKKNDVFILDITCPFENGLIASDDARIEKETC